MVDLLCAQVWSVHQAKYDMHAVLSMLGFTSDVKLWFVQFTKAGDYHQVTRAMQLTGHQSGVYHCSLSADSTR